MNQITPIVRRIDGELSLRVPVHRAEDLTDGGANRPHHVG